ncbi:MAG TPA: hypothetical protein VEB21_15910 [Terriglobales bacterium]|nr:hypothetical protein [Terriglobales bacterium]
MTAASHHRLDGLEPDNLLAFLALLGLIRALEASDRGRDEGDALRPRAAWDIDAPPLRPRLFLARVVAQEALVERALGGIDSLIPAYDFGGQKDLNYSPRECRAMLKNAATGAQRNDREHVDLLSALMSDAAIKEEKKDPVIDPTPLCLLFGQGHQHFLDRLFSVPRQPYLNRRKASADGAAARCLDEALFAPWHRSDESFSFRWDPEEDVRYALMAGDPTDSAFKSGTQHGANRLAALGLSVLTLAPEVRAGRVRPSIIGGRPGRDGFSFAWPVWREPATLAAIRAMLSHPRLHEANGLVHLGVDHVLIARRISVGKFMNFSRARALDGSWP